jgi:hypothetical protein
MWSRIKRDNIETRHIILHYHIFKNAGTTIYFILKRNFGNRVASLESERFNIGLTNKALIDFVERHPKIKAITSHHLRPPKPTHELFVFHDILFLRNPLARLSSMYDFYRRTNVTQDPLTKEAKTRTTADFMRLLIDSHPHQVNNAQVRYLAGRNRKSNETELQAAHRIASQSTVLGVTELFDIGAVIAEFELGPLFHGLSFRYVARNVSSIGPRDLEVHLSQFRKACGDQIFEQLVNANSLDLELLDLARVEVHRRFHLIPDYDGRLRNFVIWRGALDPHSIEMTVASNHPSDFVHYANLGTN